MSKHLVIALPSKGRLMEKAQDLFARAGYDIARIGHERGYRGTIGGVKDAEVAFLSASEIAHHLREGKIDLGVTGEDLLRENIARLDDVAEILTPLQFGFADVVAAVPESWLDCATMSDLEDIAEDYFAGHGRRLRVATKYLRLTRQFFARHGVSGYRTVVSLGATEGAPAAGMAEMIVDITSSGSTLRANHLKVLDDGVILRSQAVLAARKDVAKDRRVQTMKRRLEKALAEGAG